MAKDKPKKEPKKAPKGKNPFAKGGKADKKGKCPDCGKDMKDCKCK